MHSAISKVTQRIMQRSAKTRAAYLADLDANIRPGPRRKRLSEEEAFRTTTGDSPADEAWERLICRAQSY